MVRAMLAECVRARLDSPQDFDVKAFSVTGTQHAKEQLKASFTNRDPRSMKQPAFQGDLPMRRSSRSRSVYPMFTFLSGNVR